MCTILLRFDPDAPTPIVVAANRDEFRDRPADDPRDVGDALFAGRDRRAGGTWLAVGLGGVAAITNVRSDSLRTDARTRGSLPFAALAGDLPGDLTTWNPFNLLVATPERVEVITHRGGGQPPACVRLAPGDHVIVNEPFDPQGPGTRQRVAQAQLDRHGPTFTALATHADDLDEALCRHGDAYGTVCATIVALGRSGAVSRYRYRAGMACSAATIDLTEAARAATEAHSG